MPQNHLTPQRCKIFTMITNSKCILRYVSILLKSQLLNSSLGFSLRFVLVLELKPRASHTIPWSFIPGPELVTFPTSFFSSIRK